eukprot:g5914.t1
MPLPVVIAAAAAASGGLFKWATGSDESDSPQRGKFGEPFRLTAEQRDANAKLLLHDPGALLDRGLTIQGKSNERFFDATAVDYNSDDDQYQLEYANGQVLWVNLKERDFKLHSADAGDGTSEDELSSEGESEEKERGASVVRAGSDVVSVLAQQQRTQSESERIYGPRGGGVSAEAAAAAESGDVDPALLAAGIRLRLGQGARAGRKAWAGWRAGVKGAQRGGSGGRSRGGAGDEEGAGGALDEMQEVQLGSDTLRALERNDASLRCLCLRRAGIGADGASLLAAALRCSTVIASLDLGQNRLGDAGVAHLSGALRELDSLTALDLCHNGIGAVGMASLAVTAPKVGALAAVALRGNGLGDDSALLLEACLQRCGALTHLDVGATGLGAKAGRAIGRALAGVDGASLTALDRTLEHIELQGDEECEAVLRVRLPQLLPSTSD